MAERAPVERDVAGSNPVPRPDKTIITKALACPFMELVMSRSPSATHSRTPARAFFYISELSQLWGPPLCQYIHR